MQTAIRPLNEYATVPGHLLQAIITNQSTRNTSRIKSRGSMSRRAVRIMARKHMAGRQIIIDSTMFINPSGTAMDLDRRARIPAESPSRRDPHRLAMNEYHNRAAEGSIMAAHRLLRHITPNGDIRVRNLSFLGRPCIGILLRRGIISPSIRL